MLNDKERTVTVGIVSGRDIRYTLHGGYELTADGTYHPLTADACFTLHDVTIGIDFHWQRSMEQTFRGALRIADNSDGTQTAINIVPVEDYLVSVISSEMSPTASTEFLKAHAVISRSWLLRILDGKGKSHRTSPTQREGEHIRWYDRDDHTLFDVCADDHCQRYQGMTHCDNRRAEEAVRATRGEVLVYRGADGEREICDARFSKCCGGHTEEFQYCWEDEPKPYLVSVSDTPEGDSHPFCDTDDAAVLSQVLKDYDAETHDFFRWTVSYTREQLTDIVRRKLGPGLGTIRSLVAVERGRSGRVSRLLIEGTEGSVVVGKELEIRRVLSTSHLYSSAFTVETTAEGFILHGSGWGHGVGLCQIGAAVMGSRGYRYDAILRHYYRGATIEKLY